MLPRQRRAPPPASSAAGNPSSWKAHAAVSARVSSQQAAPGAAAATAAMEEEDLFVSSDSDKDSGRQQQSQARRAGSTSLKPLTSVRNPFAGGARPLPSSSSVASPAAVSSSSRPLSLSSSGGFGGSGAIPLAGPAAAAAFAAGSSSSAAAVSPSLSSAREQELTERLRAAEQQLQREAAKKDALVKRTVTLERQATATQEQLERVESERQREQLQQQQQRSGRRPYARSRSRSRSGSRSRSRSPSERFAAREDEALQQYHRGPQGQQSDRRHRNSPPTAPASSRAVQRDTYKKLTVGVDGGNDARTGHAKRLPLSVTGGVVVRGDRHDDSMDEERKEPHSSYTAAQRRRERDARRHQQPHAIEAETSRQRRRAERGEEDELSTSRSTPRSSGGGYRRPPDSPSLSALLRDTEEDQVDPSRDPLGRHHHARVHELTRSARPELTEWTTLTRDEQGNTVLEHHVGTRAARGTDEERTLAEMEHIMRQNDEFPDKGRIQGPSGFGPVESRMERQRHERTAAEEDEDEMLGNVLGDPLVTHDPILDDPAFHDAYHLANNTPGARAALLKQQHDPFLDEEELEAARPRAALPSRAQRVRQAASGSDSPVLELSERERAVDKMRQEQQLFPQRKKRSDSLGELDAYAQALAAAATANPDAPLLPPPSPKPLLTPRHEQTLAPPETPRTPTDFGIGARPLERARKIAEEEQQARMMVRQHGGVRDGAPQMRDLFDVSPRMHALGPASKPRLGPTLQVNASEPTGADAPLPSLHRDPFGQREDAMGQISLGADMSHLHSDHHLRHISGSGVGDVFGSIEQATSAAAFDAHRTAMCGLCAERPSVVHCFDCNLSLCSGARVRDSRTGGAQGIHGHSASGSIPAIPTAAAAATTELEAGCHEAVHQEFTGHQCVLVSDLGRLAQQDRARTNKDKAVARANAREERERGVGGGGLGGDFQASLLLVEPIDPLELAPPAPPSPPRFLALESYLADEARLEKESTIDLLSLQGICALCQHAKGSVWCEDCRLVLCSSARVIAVDGGTALVTAEDASNPDCDHALHTGSHAGHSRVAYNPSIHKRSYRTQAMSDAVMDAKAKGYSAGDPVSPPPSLPPSNLPSPRVGRVSSKELAKHVGGGNLPPGSFNYKTGSANATCDICGEKEAVLFCQQCQFFLCVANGCDRDVHAFQNEVEGAANGRGSASGSNDENGPVRTSNLNNPLTSHHRISLKDPAHNILITPLPSARFTPPSSARRYGGQARSRSRSRSRSPRSSRSTTTTATPRTPRSGGGSHLHKLSRNPWCSKCQKNKATVSCLSCEMNFCQGGKAGKGSEANCDAAWHASEPSFKQHKRNPVDPAMLDASMTPRFPPSTPRGPPALSEEEKQKLKQAELDKAALSARRAAEESAARAAETAELERRARERRLDESLEDDDDDVAAFQRAARERARIANREDLGATPRTIKKHMLGDDGFDPAEVQPVPQCAECGDQRADVYCFDCKKFLCAHALNYFDFAPVAPRGAIGAAGSTNQAQRPGPPQTPTHHNNCFYHVHNLLPPGTKHRSTDLPHHTAEKERRRAQKADERARQLEAQKQEAAALAAEAQAARAAIAAQEDARLRAIQEKKLQRIQAKQERLRQRTEELDAWRAEQRAIAEAERRAAQAAAEAERQHWLDAARRQIAAMDAERAKHEADLQAEISRERAKHAALIAARSAKLVAEEARRWEQHRADIRRKRVIRAENMQKQREWLARKEREEQQWRDKMRADLLAKADAARVVALEEAAKQRELDASLRLKAARIGVKVDELASRALASSAVSNAGLVRVSEGLRIRRQDQLELEADRRREAKEAERRAVEEGMAEGAQRRREQRERDAKHALRDQALEHRDRLAELRDQTREQERVKERALDTLERAERSASRQADRNAQALEDLEAERRKLAELRARKRAREIAARNKQLAKQKAMGRIAEEGSTVSGNSSTLTSSRTSSTVKPLSLSTISSVRSMPQGRRGGARSQSSKASSSSSRTGTASSFRSDVDSLQPSDSMLSSAVSSARSGASANNTNNTATNTARTASTAWTAADSAVTAGSLASAATGATGTNATVEPASSFSFPRFSGGEAGAGYDGDDATTTTSTALSDEDDADISADSFLDTARSERSLPKQRKSRDKQRRTSSRSHSRSRSESGSRSASLSEGDDSDATADDLSVTNSALARHRARRVRPAPSASELLRAAEASDLLGHFSLDQLQERDRKGRLKGRVLDNASRDASAQNTARSEAADTFDISNPRAIASAARTQTGTAGAGRAVVDPREVWALHVGASERGSDAASSFMADDDVRSALSFHTEMSDTLHATPRSDDLSQLSGLEGHRIDNSAEQQRRQSRRMREQFANEDAGALASTAADRRALRHASATQPAYGASIRRDAHQLSAQLLELLDHAPGVSAPLRSVFRMLVAKWLSESQRKERDTQIVQRAFSVLLNKMSVSGDEDDGSGGSGGRRGQLAQLWDQLLHVRDGGPTDSSEADFQLGLRRGEVDESNALNGGSYSARRDGATDLLVRPGALAAGSAGAAGNRRQRDLDEESVMGPSRSVTGEAERDALDRVPLTDMQKKHLDAQRRMITVDMQRAAIQRRARRVLQDDPFSDDEDQQRYDESFDESQTSSALQSEFRREQQQSRFGGAGASASSEVGSDATSRAPGEEQNSLASFSLGLDPRAQAAEDLRVRKLARRGKLNPLEQERNRISALQGEFSSSSSSSSEDDDDLYGSEVSAIPIKHRRDPKREARREQFYLPPDSSAATWGEEDRWYVDFHARQARKQERRALAEQDQYNAARAATIHAVQQRDVPIPSPSRHNPDGSLTREALEADRVEHMRRQQQQQPPQGDSFNATDPFAAAIAGGAGGAVAQRPSMDRMAATLEGEVGALQAVAGLRAQAAPRTFLPHEIRQHELRFGPVHVDPAVLAAGAAAGQARAFDEALQRQMRASAMLDAAHGLSVTATSVGKNFLHTYPHPAGAMPLPHQHAAGNRGMTTKQHKAARQVSAVSAARAAVPSTVQSKRVRDALFKAQLSMALDQPTAFLAQQQQQQQQQLTTAALLSPGAAAAAAARAALSSSPLPAASNIDPSLAYMQQLRRREIKDASAGVPSKR